MDLYLFNLINQFAGRWLVLDNLAVFLADKFGYVLVILVFITFWRRWKVVIQIFGAAILARLGIVELIRFLLPRTRPFVENQVSLLISHDATSSFPSGHAAFYFAIAAVVYFYNKKAGLLFFLAAFLISLARVFAGIHWPLDILAGVAVGIISGWLVVRVFETRH